jgi:hypothetical protein
MLERDCRFSDKFVLRWYLSLTVSVILIMSHVANSLFVLVLTSSSPFVLLRFKSLPANIGLHFQDQDKPVLFAGCLESR